jgi:hypothetical protein
MTSGDVLVQANSCDAKDIHIFKDRWILQLVGSTPDDHLLTTNLQLDCEGMRALGVDPNKTYDVIIKEH